MVSDVRRPRARWQRHAHWCRCDAPVATRELAENPEAYVVGSAYQIPGVAPLPLVRLLARQSGCFRVVDRSAGLRGPVQGQALREAGVLRKDTTVRKGRGYEAGDSP